MDFPVPEDPRRTNVFAGREQRLHAIDPLARHVADGEDGHADRDHLRLGELPGVVADVELREHDDRIGAGVPRRREVALQAARIEVGVQPGHEQHRVDVGDEDVLLGFQPRGLARDLRAAREQRLDREAISGCVADDDPVADRRHAAPELVVAHAAARAREPIAELRAHVVAAAVLRDDASGQEAALVVRVEGRLELVGPAEGGQGSIGQRKTPSLGGEPGRGSCRRGGA